ncbi:TolC family outer membrane protein [Duganella sp. Dugasp56]|uniref:TolC family outer membrane protein n=1 Tax=Duganella sp. Dugasp56 TaxID=3243046 RepID=UPI0039AEAC30
MSSAAAKRPLLKLLAVACCAGTLFHSGSASAIGLLQAYQAALVNDPTYRSAFFDAESGKEYKALGRSGLLPNISGNYSFSKNRADQTTETVLGPDLTHPRYLSRSASIQLRQVLFSLDALARYKQGVAQSQYSEAQFSSQGQDLILRLTGAYLEAALGTEQVRLATAQRDAQREQMASNNKMFEKGEGTRTDMLETQARLELSEAQVLEAKDAQLTSMNTLESLVGEPIESLDELGATFRLRPVLPESFEDWKAMALKNNPDLDAQRFAIESSRQEVNKNRAGHTPRVDFVSSYSKSTAESLNTYNQESTNRSIGVQINIPLYAGGAVSASTRQAVANFEKNKSDLELKTGKVMVELRKQYNGVISSAARIAALDKALASAELLLTATAQSIKGGVRVNLDLLNAQQQFYTTKRDLTQARYNYLIGMLRLRAAAGVLGLDDVREAANYFN